MFRCLVLTYHSLRGGTGEYGTDDHTALDLDIAYALRSGFRFVTLRQVVERLRSGQPNGLDDQDLISLTFDDGADYDYFDHVSPTGTRTLSFANILRKHSPQTQERISATSFVIVNPEARKLLDERTAGGRGNWSDDWWLPAEAEGVLEIGNHSWDHNHEVTETSGSPTRGRGGFASIDDAQAASFEIDLAENYLRRSLSRTRPSLFAYPYGEYNEFLANDFLPSRSSTILGAVTTAGVCVTERANPYLVPRFVCGDHWRSAEEFACLLKDSR